jgi:hypothetical protein
MLTLSSSVPLPSQRLAAFMRNASRDGHIEHSVTAIAMPIRQNSVPTTFRNRNTSVRLDTELLNFPALIEQVEHHFGPDQRRKEVDRDTEAQASRQSL